MGKEDRNIWLDGVMGVIVGDALGCPVQFKSRKEIVARGPVIGMEGHGTFDMPEGTWTDDGSMTLALLDSIRECVVIDLPDIMDRFCRWCWNGEYTPFGKAFDIGNATIRAISKYGQTKDVTTCGGTSERDNGNGSLMRILPACLYCFEQNRRYDADDAEVVRLIHEVSGLTHNHIRAKIGCGLYYFMVRGILDSGLSLEDRLQKGLDDGFAYYESDDATKTELSHYDRLRSLKTFSGLGEEAIKGSGYVVEALEAAVWCLVNTDSFKDCLLKVVNLGDDTDTVAAIAGGLAGLYYGYDAIPSEWLSVIQRREWIEEMCEM